ncbi:MAG TPA: ACT domain-containing protein [Patescibacteria group bacterium]|nr:ACT domain-containing protein [Patescibacteria group bacterium]
MHAFIVDLTNKPGELARVTEAIAEKGINIEAFAGATAGGAGSVVLATNDEPGTRRALADAGCSSREVELVMASLDHVPGGLAAVARKLADAGINIEAAMPTGMAAADKVMVSFATDNPTKAREILGASAPTGIGVG